MPAVMPELSVLERYCLCSSTSITPDLMAEADWMQLQPQLCRGFLLLLARSRAGTFHLHFALHRLLAVSS